MSSGIASLGLPGLIATAGGVGKLTPKAPGTVGSLLACALALFIPEAARLALIGILCVVGTWAAHVYAAQRGLTDPQEVVIDEVAGQLLAMAGHITSPAAGGLILPCFILFRIFDIIKPWPVCACERAPGGVGIMLDDIAAGILANATLIMFRYFFLGGLPGWLM